MTKKVGHSALNNARHNDLNIDLNNNLNETFGGEASMASRKSKRRRRSKPVLDSLSFFMPFLLPEKTVFTLILTLGFFSRFLLLLNSHVFSEWVRNLCITQGNSSHCGVPTFLFKGWTSDRFVLALFLCTLFGFLGNSFFRIAVSRICVKLVGHFYDYVTKHVSKLPMSYFDSTPVGKIVSRFASDYGAIFRMFGGPMGEFFCLGFDLILISLLLSYASFALVPLLAFAAWAQWIVFQRNRKTLGSERDALSQIRAPSISHFAETVQGRVVIRSSGKMDGFRLHFSNKLELTMRQREKISKLVQLFSFSSGLMSLLCVTFAGLYGMLLLKYKLIDIGELTLAMTLLSIASSTIVQFFEYISIFQESLAGFDRLSDFLRLNTESDFRNIALGGNVQQTNSDIKEREIVSADYLKTKPIGLQRLGLTVQNLTLSYTNSRQPVLSDVSFSIAPGEHIGVVGRTGSGKSSLLQALFLLYPWDSGDYSIGEQPVEVPFHKNHKSAVNESSGILSFQNGLDVDYVRSILGFVTQDVVMFKGTLRENIDPLNKHDTMLLLALLENIGLTATLGGIPNESILDLVIQERGANLSAGQKQLVCFVRILLANQPILFLDEATSAVDPLCEYRIETALRGILHDKTQVIVAHRLSTITHCDRILWLERGRVIDFDKPAKILKTYKKNKNSFGADM